MSTSQDVFTTMTSDLSQLPVFTDDEADLSPDPASTPEVRPTAESSREGTASSASSFSFEQALIGRSEQFWTEVSDLHRSVGDRLAKQLEGREGVTREAREELGRSLIEQVIGDRSDSLIVGGVERWDATRQGQMKAAVFDSLFRLGRLQPLVDDPTVENIKIYGHDRVYVIRTTGEIDQVDPVASCDEDLVRWLQDLAAREGDRTFSRASPMLDLPLPGRARMAATGGWITADGRPTVTIRMQRLRDARMRTLMEAGQIDRLLANFLSAAVRARLSIVVSGQSQGSGKTTMVRALANEIPPHEVVATIETEPELFLHENGEDHPMVNSYISRRGSGERDAMGRRIGEITTLDIIPSALRHNITRIIVGEVRHHSDLDAMLEAMQMGNGSLSTVHANSPALVLSRLVRMATYATASPQAAHQEIGDVIDLVVYIGMDRDPGSGRLYRYVREVSEVAYSADAGRAIVKPIFSQGPDGRAVPDHLPSGQMLALVERHGFDRSMFTTHPDGMWGELA